MKTLSIVFCAVCCALLLTPATAQTVTVSKTIYAPGEKIVVTYSGFAGNPRDWVSIAQPGSADDQYLIWSYTDGKPSGTISFDGRAYGTYEIRGYFNNEGIIRARTSFKVGNADNNLVAKTTVTSYKPYEKITVEYSGLPGNNRDWISLSATGSADGQYVLWTYLSGKQSGTIEFNGLAEGSYEVRTHFNEEPTVRSRYAFTVAKSGTKIWRNELSTFYAGMNSLGLCWGRLGSDAFIPAMISNVQLTLGNVTGAIKVIPCLDFDAARISDFSSRLPALSRQQAVDEIDRLIKELGAAINKAHVSCDKGTTLEALFITGVHLGAAQAIASTFICRPIPPDWQTNINNHLSTARNALQGFSACVPSVNLSVFNTVPVNAPNAYEALSVIIGIHTQVLWAVSLSDCCCYCQ